MDRLSIILTLMTGAVLTGALVIAAFTAELYSWPVIAAAAAIGFLASWPAAYFVSRWIKREDPDWDETKASKTGPVPRPDAPEV